MKYDLFQYYGVDFAAAIFSLIGLWMLGNKNKYGFIFGLLGTLSWTIFNILVCTIPGVISNIIFMLVHTRGFIKWLREK